MNDLFNFGTFFKFLEKNKLYTLIDVFGLSVSLMFVILIAVYTQQELSFDRFHSKADRIYILGSEKDLGSAFRLAYRIQERYPEIEKVCPIAPWYHQITVNVNDTKLNINLLFSDSTFFDFFDFKLYTTNPKQVLTVRNYAVISRTFARKAFGNEDPIGKSITLNDSVSVIVNGIMDDIKNSTIPYCDVLVRIDNIRHFNPGMDSETFDNFGSSYIFILEKENANLQAKTEDMLTFFKDIVWIYQRGMTNKVKLVPLKDIYFSDIHGDGEKLKQGDWRLVMILMSVGIAILIFAIINYINLTVAQSGFRAKEMATRRLLGSSRQELFVRLILESTLLCFLSFFLALLLAALCAPYAGELLNTKINITGAVSFWSILTSTVIILIIGAVSGWLPATFISKVNPIDITKGSIGRKNKMVFSRFFIIFQNVITIMMLVASITMAAQTWHLIHAPLGYNTANIINIPTDNFNDKGEISVFANEVKQLASVKRLGFAQGNPLNAWNNTTVMYKDKNIAFQMLGGDTAVFEILGFQMLKDNHSGNPASFQYNQFYFSRQAMKEAELDENATEIRINDNWTIQVNGIIGDIHLGNVTRGLDPVLFFFSIFDLNSPWWYNPWNIFIETQDDPQVTFQQIKQVYEREVKLDFAGKFMDDMIKESFASQQRISKIVILFTVIAILISLLGLLAMSTYFIRQHTKEIAIRKVYGADNFRTLSQLVSTFLGYVGIAFVIAVPFIATIMKRWLSDYSYRISLSPWIFITAGSFCLFVAFVSVYWQSRRAANANPVDSLKSE